MTPETFMANFGHLADASNGVQKLRELILQLAVQGKFSDQHNQEGWRNYTLGDLGAWGSGGTPSSKETRYYGGDIPWLIIRDLNDGLVLHAANSITKEGLENSSAKIVPPNTLLIAMYGSIGKLGITGIQCATNQAIAFCQPDDELVDLWFLFHYLRAIRISLLARGQGLAQQNISQKILKAVAIKLPPLEEQKRIVAKVDQLMTLCDELEARQQKQQQGRMRLNNASLDALLTAREPDEFTDHWQRISTNFDLLYDHPKTIAKLRAAIFQLAVQGKLVPQDPSEVPASVLMERIRAEKERSVEEGGIRKEKPLPALIGSNVPYALPKSWQWVRFGLLWQSSYYGPRFGKNEYVPTNGVPTIRTTDMTTKGLIHLNNPPQVTVPKTKMGLYRLKKGDLLVTRSGSIGTMAIFNLDLEAIPSAYLIRLRFVAQLEPFYLQCFLQSPMGQSFLGLNSTSVGVPNINATKMALFACPLPPKQEQKRIVAKVDQLMALCDELEAKLNQAQQHSEKLMEASVRQLLGTSEPLKPHAARQAAKTAPRQSSENARQSYEAAPEPAIAMAAEASAAYQGNIPAAILDRMLPGTEYSRGEILQVAGISEVDWVWSIRQLKEQGKVVQKGEKRGARYLRK